MNRRNFLKGFAALAGSALVVPEWLLDPPKGRSQVQVQVVKVNYYDGDFVELLDTPLRKIFLEAMRQTPPEYVRWLKIEATPTRFV